MSDFETKLGQQMLDLARSEGHVRKVPVNHPDIPIEKRSTLARTILDTLRGMPPGQTASAIGAAMGHTRQSIAPSLFAMYRSGALTRELPPERGVLRYSLAPSC